MVGLETALPIVITTMVNTNRIHWSDVARIMSSMPAHIGRVNTHGQAVEVGSAANFCVVDPHATFDVDPFKTSSKSHNNPFAGMNLSGVVQFTMLRGNVTYRNGE